MNQADRGRHLEAAELLTESAAAARQAGTTRQEAWSQGVLARSLLLAGQLPQAQQAAEHSMAVVRRERWNAFLPWPQVLHAHCLAQAGRWDEASEQAEHAFALACELGDPCWEGMAARALGMLAVHAGDLGAAQAWLADARRRCDRVPDRYVWVSAYVGLAQLETAARQDPGLVAPAAARLYEYAARSDLPEFLAWALVYQAESGDQAKVPLARSAADGIANPDLQARVQALPGGEPDGRSRGKRLSGMTTRRHEHGATARLPAPAAGHPSGRTRRPGSPASSPAGRGAARIDLRAYGLRQPCLSRQLRLTGLRSAEPAPRPGPRSSGWPHNDPVSFQVRTS